MPRIINLSIEVSDEEMSNFLARMSGADGRKVDATPVAETDDGPAATDAPSVDKNGVAWDARYHASSKALNADGTWRARKGMSDAEKAEADAYNKGGTVIQTSDLAALPVETVTEGPVSTQPEAVAMPAPALPAMPGLPVAAPVVPEPVSYEQVVAAYTAAIAKNPALDVPGLYAKAGVTDPNKLTTDEGAEQRIALKKLFDEVSA